MKKLLIMLIIIFLAAGCTPADNNTPGNNSNNVVPPEKQETLTVHFFSLGKADAILISDGEHRILVDTGYRETAEQLTGRLKELGVSELDLLILTHFDKDHIGGAAAIIDSFAVKEILQGGYVKDSSPYRSYIEALSRRGLTAKLVDRDLERSYGSLRLNINPPAEKEYEKDPSNNSSLITMLAFQDCSFLLMGDAENLRLKEYAELAVKSENNVILKVPHHGDYHKNLALILDRYRPTVSIICCSDSDPEPVEVAKTLALLSQYGSAAYRTSEGEITVTVDQGKITIHQ